MGRVLTEKHHKENTACLRFAKDHLDVPHKFWLKVLQTGAKMEKSK